MEIKKLINYYALFLKPKRELRERIDGIIKAANKKLPISLFERYKYILGLKETSEKMIRDFYDPVVEKFKMTMAMLLMIGISVTATNPYELNKIYATDKHLIRKIARFEPNVWSAKKGYPNVIDYQKNLKTKLRELARTQTVSSEPGKKPISIWQKAEIDLRHEHQTDMISNLIDNGVKLAWISTHPDCSKRCEKWQGKLMDLVAKHSELSGHRMRYKVEGNTVYCFNEIISQVDKYGYTNNVIVGFNCRHKLVPYTSGSVAPQEYTAKQIKKQREINSQLRAMEREIRYLKQQSILYNSVDKKLAKKYEEKAKKLMQQYKAFADKNGYAWYEYRIRV